ncbi:MAG: AMP-binding protein [Bacteroidales bacterium]
MKNDFEEDKYLKLFLEQWINHKSYIIARSSGSTGIPKEIRLQKSYMICSALRTGKFFDFQAEEKVLLPIPIRYIGGMMMIVRALVFDLDLYVRPARAYPFYPMTFDFDFSPMTPMQAYDLLSDEKGKAFFLSIRNIILGGSGVSEELQSKIEDLPNRVYSTYGMTETISHIALRSLNQPKEEFYKVLPGIEIDSDADNCLIIKDESGSCFKTNDIVLIQDKNQFIVKGRKDNIINSGGKKIIPEELEKRIENLLTLKNSFFVFGIDNERFGDKLCLLEEVKEGMVSDFDIFNCELLKVELEKNCCPKEFFSIDSFVYTDTGKINRKASIELFHKTKKGC